MRKPIKRKIELRSEYLYELKDGTKAIFCYWNWNTNKAVFRKPHQMKSFYLLYWNRNVVKRLRRRLENE